MAYLSALLAYVAQVPAPPIPPHLILLPSALQPPQITNTVGVKLYRPSRPNGFTVMHILQIPTVHTAVSAAAQMRFCMQKLKTSHSEQPHTQTWYIKNV